MQDIRISKMRNWRNLIANRKVFKTILNNGRAHIGCHATHDNETTRNEFNELSYIPY